MTASSGSSSGTSSSRVDCTIAAGSMSHIARGFCSWETKSASEEEAVAPSLSSCFTASALTS